MKAKLRLLTLLFAVVAFSTTSYAQNEKFKKKLIVKAHHNSDENTIVRIWRTNQNKYIIRTSSSTIDELFSQKIIEQFNKEIKWNGFSKSVIFKESPDAYWTLTHANSEYLMAFSMYVDVVDKTVTASYIIDYIDKQLFNDL